MFRVLKFRCLGVKALGDSSGLSLDLGFVGVILGFRV